MQTLSYLNEIVNELSHTVQAISDEEAEQLANRILQARKVFVAGAGRSGLMGKAFAMRMMQMGLDAYVIGETVTPSFGPDDLLIIASGSGETKGLESMAAKAKNLGGSVAAITIFPKSSIGKLADVTVKLPAAPKDQSNDDYNTIQPMGSLFEQTVLLFCDSLILRIMNKKDLDSRKMYGRHANLE